MAKPKLTDYEIETVISSLNNAGSSIIDFNEVKQSLVLGDQTIERFRNLIIPELNNRGFIANVNGNNIHFESPQKNTSSTSNSELTNLSHQFITPRNYSDLMIAVRMNGTPLFVGPKGCGKSITAEVLCHDLGKNYFKRDNYKVTRFSLGGCFNPADLLGEMLLFDSPLGGGVITKYVYGYLSEAVENGYALILDEVDCASPEVNSLLQRITETDGKIIIKTEKGSISIKRHPHYRLIYTANTYLTGDYTGMFAGAMNQNSAFRDRITAIFEFDYTPEHECMILLKDYKLPPKVVEALYGTQAAPMNGLVNVVRAACKAGTIQDSLSMRTITEFAKHYAAFNGPDKNKSYSWHKAMNICFVRKFPPQYHNQVRETIGKILGPELIPTEDRKEIEKHTDFLKSKGFFPTQDTYIPPELLGIYN